MASTTIHISERTQQLLSQLAVATGEPPERVLEDAVECYRNARFFAGVRDAYARLAADPAAWADELAERSELEGTLHDGLHEL